MRTWRDVVVGRLLRHRGPGIPPVVEVFHRNERPSVDPLLHLVTELGSAEAGRVRSVGGTAPSLDQVVRVYRR